MQRLNYNHLRCFWAVAKTGNVTAACQKLGLSQPTISKQISDLEGAFGAELFRRTGRRMVLTEMGRSVESYANDIFELGEELESVMQGQSAGRQPRLRVGISDVVPKILSRVVLEPALTGDDPVHLVCREGKTDRLLAELVVSGLDAVLADSPPPKAPRLRVHYHALGSSPVGLFGLPALAERVLPDFPASLNGAPILLPLETSTLRQSVDAWLDENDLHPRVVAEIEDSALLKSFAEAGHGLFFAPMAVRGQLEERMGVRLVRQLDEISETIYIITMDRRVAHPGLTAIVEAAGRTLGG
ncbi:MAG: LysR family transcriptional regulator [Phycisphaerales bacterium]